MSDRQTSALILVVITAFLLWLQNTGKLPIIISAITGTAGVFPSSGVQAAPTSGGIAALPGLVSYVLPTAPVPTQTESSGGGGGGKSGGGGIGGVITDIVGGFLGGLF